MDKIKVITDSTCDLPEDILKDLDIEVIPLSVNIGSRSYKDGEDITFDELMDMAVKNDDFPTTSQVTPDILKDIYEKYLDKGYKIISIHVSSKLSETYQSASIAKNILETKDIYIFDSLNVSLGLGLIVKDAAEMVRDGYSLEEICKNIEQYTSTIQSCIIINDLANLVRSGRISKTMGVLARLFKIKPIIGLLSGEIVLLGKLRGKKALLNHLIQFIEKNNIDKDSKIYIVYSKGSIILDDIKLYLNNRGYNFYVGHVGCVIGSYTSKGCTGIFIKNN